jgi:transmembrane sensor
VVSAARARFNIRNLGGEVCVTCLAGQVEVARGAQRARLDAGRQLRYGPGGHGPVAAWAGHAAAATGAVSAWRRRQLVFDQVPLAEVVAEVNRYRRGRLVLTSEALGRSKVQASFSIDRLDDVAGAGARRVRRRAHAAARRHRAARPGQGVHVGWRLAGWQPCSRQPPRTPFVKIS